MQKMKNGKKVLSVCLSLAMARMLSTSAFASWNVYGGSSNHNAVVTEAPTAPDKSGLDSYIQLHCTGSGWDGVDNVPVLQTVNGTTYAYVLYDGYGASGALVAKIRCAENGGSSIVWTTDPYGTEGTSLNAKSGFQLSTPYLDDNGTPDDASDDTLYVGTISQYDDYEGGEWLTGTGSKVMALTGLDQNKPTVTNVLTGIWPDQHPITTDGTYLYFGTWPGGSNCGNLLSGQALRLLGEDLHPRQLRLLLGRRGDDSTNVYFGSNGLLYWRNADFDNWRRAGSDRCGQRRGHVRSTVMMDEDGFLYFTTQGGYLWCCSYKDGLTVEWHIKLGATSTSTPTKVGDRIYVGYYSGFNAGGVQCVTVSIGEDGSSYIPSVAPVASGFPVQSSIVVMGDGTGTDYLYFNTNAQKGAGYCYSYDGGTTGSKVWGTTGDTYALGGMAIDNGYAVFGNDYNHLYVVHD
ncbi:MAG: hypothetical protein ACLT5P_05760 [Flavonifractor plautii]